MNEPITLREELFIRLEDGVEIVIPKDFPHSMVFHSVGPDGRVHQYPVQKRTVAPEVTPADLEHWAWAFDPNIAFPPGEAYPLIELGPTTEITIRPRQGRYERMAQPPIRHRKVYTRSMRERWAMVGVGGLSVVALIAIVIVAVTP